MKKLCVFAAIVCAAAVTEAATFKWTTSSAKLYGVVAADVVDNGDYAVATSGTVNRGDKVLSLTYTLTLLDVSTDAVVGSVSGDVAYGTLGKVSTQGMEISAAADNTAYKYVFALEGTQSNLSSRGAEESYDYSAAALYTEFSGTITTASMGDTSLFESDTVPSTWTVSGIVSSGGTPEPTSGLLLLVGGSLLALRRKQK